MITKNYIAKHADKVNNFRVIKLRVYKKINTRRKQFLYVNFLLEFLVFRFVREKTQKFDKMICVSVLLLSNFELDEYLIFLSQPTNFENYSNGNRQII